MILPYKKTMLFLPISKERMLCRRKATVIMMRQKPWGRAVSFVLLAVIYLLAAAVGVCVYLLCPLHFTLRLLIADVAATLFVFVFSLLFRNASVYDPYWSVQPPVIVTAFAIGYGVTWLGACLLFAVWFWAIRLTANWAYTFRGLSHQDWRYTMLREKTGKFYPIINWVGIHLVPTLVVYGCILPVVYALVSGWDSPLVGTVLCALAVLSASMQGVADIQMQAFRKKCSGGFIRTGLWKYSRHPNYLGEILQWWFVALAVVCASGAWLLSVGAVANTLLFLCVSIPMADGRQGQKDGWAVYKKQTRMLLPIYKKQ